jgi:hypothetical protein
MALICRLVIPDECIIRIFLNSRLLGPRYAAPLEMWTPILSRE